MSYWILLLICGCKTEQSNRYIILQLGLAGPILQISGTVIREIRQIAAKKLREAFADVPEAQRVLAQPVTASSSDGQERKGDLLKGEMLEK